MAKGKDWLNEVMRPWNETVWLAKKLHSLPALKEKSGECGPYAWQRCDFIGQRTFTYRPAKTVIKQSSFIRIAVKDDRFSGVVDCGHEFEHWILRTLSPGNVVFSFQPAGKPYPRISVAVAPTIEKTYPWPVIEACCFIPRGHSRIVWQPSDSIEAARKMVQTSELTADEKDSLDGSFDFLRQALNKDYPSLAAEVVRLNGLKAFYLEALNAGTGKDGAVRSEIAVGQKG